MTDNDPIPRLVGCRCCFAMVSNQATYCPHCGQPDPGPATTWETEAKEMLRQGKKIQAIRLVRASTGLSLADAKEVVDSWDR